jgi:hypothetical protein
MSYAFQMAPSMAPPAGGFKWRDDAYWGKNEGLMTVTWPHHYEGRERTKNTAMTINARTLSGANLPEMTIRPGDRPSTVPASFGSQNKGRRFLDNIDQYMGKDGSGAPMEQSDSVPNTPGRGCAGPSQAKRRAMSSSELGVARRRQEKDAVCCRTQGKGVFKDNMYFFGAGMARAEPLVQRSDQERAAYGLTPYSQIKARMAAGGQMRKMAMAGPQGPQGAMGAMGIQGVQFTTNQNYGNRAGEAGPPVIVTKDKCGSNIVMGM